MPMFIPEIKENEIKEKVEETWKKQISWERERKKRLLIVYPNISRPINMIYEPRWPFSYMAAEESSTENKKILINKSEKNITVSPHIHTIVYSWYAFVSQAVFVICEAVAWLLCAGEATKEGEQKGEMKKDGWLSLSLASPLLYPIRLLYPCASETGGERGQLCLSVER